MNIATGLNLLQTRALGRLLADCWFWRQSGNKLKMPIITTIGDTLANDVLDHVDQCAQCRLILDQRLRDIQSTSDRLDHDDRTVEETARVELDDRRYQESQKLSALAGEDHPFNFARRVEDCYNLSRSKFEMIEALHLHLQALLQAP